ncbi:acyl carrier protein [Lampropedia puyangensis]|uniref:Acyl carrier protein n=1 Tax=Lampropedia puyangensis TaxID=1330072 RepID=A0A4V6T2R6_9BURK|nr:phosphopantetheine-binding protein [Lampropedia puyangensis]THU02576.1 acyl carrier protein [Lampropedia puyangensis]
MPQAAALIELEHELKELIIETLALEDIAPNDIISTDALFNEGLGLDSIDALELGLALKSRYGISVSSDSQETRKHFQSVRALAEFVSTSRSQA